MLQLVVVPFHIGRFCELLEQLPDEVSLALTPGEVGDLHAEVDVDELADLVREQQDTNI